MPAKSRPRTAVLCLIGVLAALDVAGAAYLHQLWTQRQAGADRAAQSRSVRASGSDSPRPPSAARVSSTR